MKKTIVPFFTLFCFVLSPGALSAQQNGVPQEASPETQASYRLSIRDLIQVSVFNEPAMNTLQRVDGNGQIRIPLLGPVNIAGQSVRNVERLIEERFIDEEIFIAPQVTLRVQEYAPKEVSVLGEVNNPGRIPFPIEANTMDIIEVISKSGGFTALARSSLVQITRKRSDGDEQTYSLNVDRMIDGRRSSRGNQEPIPILPGDTIYVPQRIW